MEMSLKLNVTNNGNVTKMEMSLNGNVAKMEMSSE